MSDFCTHGFIQYNPRRRAIGPRFGLSGCSWPILWPWQDGCKHRFSQKSVPQKQLVRSCPAGPCTPRGLVITWCSQIWHSLFHSPWTHGTAGGVHTSRVLRAHCAPLSTLCTLCTLLVHCAHCAPPNHPNACNGHISATIYRFAMSQKTYLITVGIR